jgi:hypothetical protein
MKTLALIGVGVITISAFATIMKSHAEEPRNALRTALGESQYESCGLHKLSTDEQQRVCGLVTGCSPRSYTEESALRYMEKSGWVKVRVLGVTIAPDDEKHVMALNGYDGFDLDPALMTVLPEPGIYWAKITGTSWTILETDGSEGSFWAHGVK